MSELGDLRVSGGGGGVEMYSGIQGTWNSPLERARMVTTTMLLLRSVLLLLLLHMMMTTIIRA